MTDEDQFVLVIEQLSKFTLGNEWTYIAVDRWRLILLKLAVESKNCDSFKKMLTNMFNLILKEI